MIDFHTHIFPDTLAPIALQKLSFASGGITPYSNGTANGLRASMRVEDIDISVVLNIATNPHPMHAVNTFAIATDSSDLIAFGSVHPDAADALEELDRLHAAGIRGVKFHPDYQHFFVDDEKMIPIYRKISQLDMITVFHAGYDFGFPPPYHCMPKNAKRMLSYFDSPVILAHWGGLACGEEVLSDLCGMNVFFDISFGCGVMPRETALRIADKHGTDKLLLGSDSPWHTPTMELSLLNTLSLAPEEFKKITDTNARQLLKLL